MLACTGWLLALNYMLLLLVVLQVADLQYNTLAKGHGPILHTLHSKHHTRCSTEFLSL
jgi:hypothetical protein